MDVLNLANNHVGDFGTTAMLDTLSYLRRFDLVGVGAGRISKRRAKPQLVKRLGLKVAFVGISDIVPPGFAAGPTTPGTTTADPSLIAKAVRPARRASRTWSSPPSTGASSATPSRAAASATSAGAARAAGAQP